MLPPNEGYSSVARLHIDAQADHVLRLAHIGDPVTGVIELIWNSLDAEATNVAVVLERSPMDAVETVIVVDNGHGMAPESISSSFEHLGGSWKIKARVSPNIQRPLNGRYGRGRLRGFALGNSISWATAAYDLTKNLKRTVISGHSVDPTNFETREVPSSATDKPGTVFYAKSPPTHINRLTADSAIPRITAAFALFLTANPNVIIVFDGHTIDPTAAEEHRTEFELPSYGTDESGRSPLLRIIEWKKDPGRTIYLCDSTGAVLDNFPAEVRTPGYNFTAYVLWDEFRDQTQDIRLAELYGGERSSLIGLVRDKIIETFRTRENERRKELVRQWKENGDYPYTREPVGEAERAEREVFDFVATTVARKIPKARLARKTTLGFLREVVAADPGSLPRILDDLFALPRRQQEDFRRLLDRTSLSNLIAANTTIANRLDFLAALRDMVFDHPTKKLVKERSELHKILERETWVFGEEYGLLLSDKGLNQVLDRHMEKLRPGEKRRRASNVQRADGTRGIVDLMLAQQRVGSSVTERLVVELKRPTVTLTNKETGQIKSYAEAVRKDSQFLGQNIVWDFWVIATKMDPVVSRDAHGINQPPGLIADWGEGVRIWAKTWSELIDDCERRLRHYKRALDHDASSEHAAEYLVRAHDEAHVPTPFKERYGNASDPG